MQLQDIFYIVSILLAIFWVIVLIFISVIMWKIFQTVVMLQNHVRDLKSDVTNRVTEFVQSNKLKLAGSVGSAVVGFIIKRIKDNFAKKESL